MWEVGNVHVQCMLDDWYRCLQKCMFDVKPAQVPKIISKFLQTQIQCFCQLLNGWHQIFIYSNQVSAPTRIRVGFKIKCTLLQNSTTWVIWHEFHNMADRSYNNIRPTPGKIKVLKNQLGAIKEARKYFYITDYQKVNQAKRQEMQIGQKIQFYREFYKRNKDIYKQNSKPLFGPTPDKLPPFLD